MFSFKKINKIILISFFLFLFLIPLTVLGVNDLEVDYPNIGTEAPADTSNLPQYLSYVYNFSFYIIGFILLGSTIYWGVMVLAAMESADKRSDALKNLRTSALGAVLVLTSFLVLNSINPDILNPNLKEMNKSELGLSSGIYFCNYKINDIDKNISNYAQGSKEERDKAAQALSAKLNPGDKDKGCIHLTFSGNIAKKIKFSDTRPGLPEHTVFSLPSRKITKEGSEPNYIYGALFHEKENFEGRATLYPLSAGKGTSKENYYKPDSYELKIKNEGYETFIPSSVTIFKKISLSEDEKIDSEVKIYPYPGYNSTSTGNESISPNLLGDLNPLDNDFQTTIFLEDFTYKDEKGYFNNNVLSIKISPGGKYLAFLFPEDEEKDVDRSYEDVLITSLGIFGEILGPKIINNSKTDLAEDLYTTIDDNRNRIPAINSILIIPGKKLN